MRTDWLPTSRSEQLAMAKKWDSYLTEQTAKEIKGLGGLWLIRLFHDSLLHAVVHLCAGKFVTSTTAVVGGNAMVAGPHISYQRTD